MSDQASSPETEAAKTQAAETQPAETRPAETRATEAQTAKAHAPEADAELAAAVEMPFQAEVQRVLTLVIDSLYANKEVFLRELISNASDALDKARFLLLTDPEAHRQEGEPAIRIDADESARTLTIEDNGIGMTRDEVIENLGTIARSGSLEFLKNNADVAKDKDKALNIIGQFGVGFYAAFMVAARVDVHTLSMKAGAQAVTWRSTGGGSFTIAPSDRTTPGTRIVLHLKEEHKDFLRAWRIKDVVQKYSDFVSFPIYVGGELANQEKALWTLPRSQVTPEQHKSFFKHLTSGAGDDAPLVTIHVSIDAPVQFHALLYVPERAPFDLFQKERVSPRLYAKRVLIIESCDRLVPTYLRFLRGVVDSEDLSLNVSREMLQENAKLTQIESTIVKQVLKQLKELAETDPQKYATFFRVFGKVLKEGLTTDYKNRDALLELARFESLAHPASTDRGEGELVSLKQYVEAMPAEQKDIYYLTGPSRRAIESSPHLEAFRKKGFDVLFLVDPIDEWVVQSIPEYGVADGAKHKLKSVVHGDLELEDKPEGDEPTAALDAVKAALGDRIKEVRFSRRLVDSASCLVSAEGDPGANLERIMKMLDERATERKRILEINPNHPIVKNLALLATKDPHSEKIQGFCELLYDQALLGEGVVEDPARLMKRIQDLLSQATAAAAS